MNSASTFRRRAWAGGLLLALAAVDPAAAASPGNFCGSAATPGDPADLDHVISDLSLQHAVEQPASMVTCAKGYLLEKCGDHENALKIFDKCIAAGYAGAMIWKALLLEDGAGIAQDSVQAAELLHRAAQSDDPAYAAIGKMHYATALHLGRGVPKDEAAARQWFQAAAAQGSEEAKEFLKTGYHTGHRELNGMGAGTPTAAALAGPPTGDNASLPRPKAEATPAGEAVTAVRLAHATAPTPAPMPETAPPPAADPAPPEADIQGQRLERRAALPPPAVPPASLGVGLLLLVSFAAGILRQRRSARSGQAALSFR
ncbi:hypothetical protein LZ012_18570 [Dechloromonas sp. XY25]|uniref:Sel1 repeat family protein n=1 Tax=Dechloromonas hankyongensis TaxID=2908002 RepID=A0ABS9K748_9RHOO|nr:hypothetical protein [Dechloromonas hankyongensis]MCG2579000.1 hypothetical protein [Dechloromonas hankyongensis]